MKRWQLAAAACESTPDQYVPQTQQVARLGSQVLDVRLGYDVCLNIDKIDAPKLVARRSTTRYITSRLDYLDNRPDYAEVTGEITDYCNSLLLIETDKGSLYVPLRHNTNGDFVMRIKLWNDNYQVIELPKGGKGSLFRSGKSKKGVYCVQDIDGRCTFKIWLLSESHAGAIDWVLSNEICFETASRIYPCKHDSGPWISQSLEQKESLLEKDVNLEVANKYNEALSRDDFEWDSDDENAVTTVDWPKKGSPGAPAHLFWCLGFHPYKEIALFHDDYRSPTFAYQLNSSKVRYLGIMDHEYSDVDISFAYTPCWTMDLPGRK
uniref:DUF1618 domain-containing protein n=1 Tax=Aegilops tauschii TaxID=37682 RepID=M8BVB1_AEGTA